MYYRDVPQRCSIQYYATVTYWKRHVTETYFRDVPQGRAIETCYGDVSQRLATDMYRRILCAMETCHRDVLQRPTTKACLGDLYRDVL